MRGANAVLLACALVLVSPAHAQVPKRPSKPAPVNPQIHSQKTDADAELQSRASAVLQARASGDAAAIAQANRNLIAVALRRMAHIRLLDGSYSAASDLYRSSLEFEDSQDTRLDLAISYLYARKADESLAEVAKVIQSPLADARAWHVQGKARMMNHDYVEAAKSLSRALEFGFDPEVAYSLGVSLLNSKQKEKAAAAFAVMRRKAPGNLGVLHVLFARAYRDANYLDDALRELNTALKIDPRTPNAHYFRGLVLLIKEGWDAGTDPQIRAEFAAELRFNPKHFLSNYLLGAIESGARNYDKSDHYLNAAAAIDGSWPEPWMYLGLNAAGREDSKNAEQFLRKAIELNGANDSRSNFLIRKAYFALGQLLNRSGRREEGTPLLKKARELQERAQMANNNGTSGRMAMGGSDAFLSDNSDAIQAANSSDPLKSMTAGQAKATLQTGDDRVASAEEKRLAALLGASFNDLATTEAIAQRYNEALVHYQQAEHWSPEIPGLMRNLGIAAARSQNYPEAIRALSQVPLQGDHFVRGSLGMSYYMMEDYGNATKIIAPLGDAILADTGMAFALADSYAKLGDTKPAGDVLEKLESQNVSPETLMLIGRTWDEIGNPIHAAEVMRLILKDNPDYPKAHYYAGLSYIHADRPAEAAPEFQAELKLNPRDADARYNLGFTYLQQSHQEEAAAIFRQVVEANPEHAQANYQLGKLLFDKGDVQTAVPYLEKAAQLIPATDYVHYQLQAAYRKQARLEDADRELAIYKQLKAKKREQPMQQHTNQ